MRQLSNVLGIDVDRLDTEGVLSRVERFVSDGKKHQVGYVNAHCLNYAFRDKGYKQALSSFDLVYPDGMAVVWGSWLYGEALPERVNLGDFLLRLCQLCVEKEHRIFLLGGEAEVAEAAAQNLKKEIPGLQIAGTHHGFFKEDEEREIINSINTSSADILLVGMGVPKQEIWISRNRDRLNPSLCWGVGALFEYYAGVTKRSPGWMRRAGLEWLFRLMTEPGRLWKRYLIGNVLFAGRLFLPVIIDVALLASAWLIAYCTRILFQDFFPRHTADFNHYLYLLCCMALIWPFIASFFKLYAKQNMTGQLGQQQAMVKVLSFTFLFAILCSFVFRELGIARSVLLIWVVVNLGLLVLSRRLLRRLDIWFLPKARPFNLLIVGTGRSASLFSTELEQSGSNYRITGFLDTGGPHDGKNPAAKNVIGELSNLEDVVTHYNVDEVALVDTGMSLAEKLNLVTRYKDLGVNFRVVSTDLEAFSQKISLDQVGNMPMLAISSREPAPAYLMIKEITDRIIGFTLFLIAVPLWAIIALAIRLDSPGPVLFVHTRVGKNAKTFKMYKFRSMYQDVPPAEPAPAREDDKRITKIGKFLRHWSIDELPQLLNVIRGHMSLVGPRPEMSFIVKDYDLWERQRLKAKPGITGLWQVVGRKSIPLHENMEYDLYYVNNRSCILDLKILLKTIPAIILRKGAY